MKPANRIKSANNSPIVLAICIFLAIVPPVMAEGETKPNEPGPIPGLYVNSFTGNLFYERNDLFIPGRKLSLDFSFYYNSGRSNSNWGYGFGWTSTFSMHYVQKGDNILIENNDGQRDEYIWNGLTYDHPRGKHNTLLEYETGKFILTSHHGMKYYFDNPDNGKITRMEDRNGNNLLFEYTESLLATITDNTGRTYELEWTDGLLQSISDNNTDEARVMSFQYDGDGNMTDYTDPLGNQFHYQYDQNNKLTEIRNARSFSTQIEYDQNQAVSSITYPSTDYHLSIEYNTEEISTSFDLLTASGFQKTTYKFDQTGRIAEIEKPDGNSVLYTWDVGNNIINYTDQNGNVSVFNYDDNNNLTRQIDPLGNEVVYTYETLFNQITSRTNKLGFSTIYEYDSRGNLIRKTDPAGNSEEYVHDEYGQKTSYTDRNGNVYGFSYNHWGNRTQTIDPLGNITMKSYDAAGNLITETNANGFTYTYSYDLLNKLISVSNPDGFISTYSYDPCGNRISETNANGHTTFYTYDPLNRLIQLTDPLNYSINYSYDPCGNLISRTDKNGNNTTYSYDPLNRLIDITDPLAFTISYSYDPVGNRISETDANGNTTNYSYDALNRLVTLTDALGNDEFFHYDAEGNLIAFTDKNSKNTYLQYDELGRRVKTINPMGQIHLYYYDNVGNLIHRADPNENIYSYSYDPLNRLISNSYMSGSSITYSYDPVGNRISETDANGNVTNYSYDPLNRLITETDALSFNTNYSYDPLGNLISETDKNGYTINYSYDPLNRLVQKENPHANTYNYSYDPSGSLVSETDENGHTVSYSYDPLGRLISRMTAMGNETRYGYSGSGTMIERTDPNGNLTEYEYDGLNRLTRTIYPLGEVQRIYDPVGNILELANIGIGINDYTTRTYDEANRLTMETIAYGAFSKTISYAYDQGGRITEIIYPDGNINQRAYNNDNDLIYVMDPIAGPTNIVKDAGGNNNRTNLPNGEYNTSEYDAMNRLLKRSTFAADGTLLFDHQHTYDASGKPLQYLKNGLPQANYVYNELNQLIIAEYPWMGQNIGYSYDPVGNRITKDVNSQVTSYAYNDDNHVVSQTMPDESTIIYTYDNNGNVVQTSSNWGTVNYGYDFENRLTQIDYPTGFGTVINHFTPEGKRIARVEDGNTTYYFPTLLGNILEMDESGNNKVRINPGISQTIITPASINTPGLQTIFTHWGSQNSTTEFTSEGIIATLEFDYFGSIQTNTGDIESIESGLFSNGMSIDWNTALGAELIGVDYAPDIDQHYGNIEYSNTFFFEPGSEPFEEIVYSIYSNNRFDNGFYQNIDQGFGPGSDPFEGHIYESGSGMMENLQEGEDGESNNRDSGICGLTWTDWIMTGTTWEYVGSGPDKTYLPQIRMLYKYELKRQQEEWQNTCYLPKGHAGHHSKSEKTKTGKTRTSSYAPPIFEYLKGPQIVSPNKPPSKKEGDKQGKEMEKDPRRQQQLDKQFHDAKIKKLLNDQ